MLDNLLGLGTEADFVVYSLQLRESENRCKLYEEIQRSDCTLHSADRWTPEFISSQLSKMDIEGIINEVLASEDKSKNIVHRLQLLGFVAPVISSHIDKFLNKACL